MLPAVLLLLRVFDLTTDELTELLTSIVGQVLVQVHSPLSGVSKRTTLKNICAAASNAEAINILRGLIEYAQSMQDQGNGVYPTKLESEVAQAAVALETIIGSNTAGALHHSTSNNSISTLVISITSNLKNNRPDAAIDHLHTYCMGRLTQILAQFDISCSRTEPLHSRYGKLKNLMESKGFVTEYMSKPLSAAIAAFEGLNTARNNHSLAHDNSLLALHEARYLIESTMAALRVVEIFVDGQPYGNST